MSSSKSSQAVDGAVTNGRELSRPGSRRERLEKDASLVRFVGEEGRPRTLDVPETPEAPCRLRIASVDARAENHRLLFDSIRAWLEADLAGRGR